MNDQQVGASTTDERLRRSRSTRVGPRARGGVWRTLIFLQVVMLLAALVVPAGILAGDATPPADPVAAEQPALPAEEPAPVVDAAPALAEEAVPVEEPLAEPTIASDQADYNPGQLVTLTGTGWSGDTTVNITVNDDQGQTWYYTDTATVAADGTIRDTFNLPTLFIAQYYVSAVGAQTGRVATTSFTDGNPSATLDQCANDPFPSPSTDGCSASASDWVNGNLGASKSSYFEGDSIPYRMLFDNLSTSGTHTVTIEWDTTKGGTHAIDYITTWNRTVATADPCLGVTGCSSPSTFAIPADSQVTGYPVTPVPGNFTLFGGTITNVSAHSYADGAGFSGDKSARITISFTASQANPVLAWGGHIATRVDWGMGGSAVAIPGSPYHTRLIDLDGSGGNQDRSLSAHAIIFPGSITVVKEATPEGSTSFPFTASPSPLAAFSLVDDNTSTNTQVFSNITDFKTYTINETPIPTNWGFDSVSCSVTSPNGGSYSTSTTTVNIVMKEGENWTCTYLDSLRLGSLKLVKVVTNNDGGAAVAGDYTLSATAATGSATRDFADNGDPTVGTSHNVFAGTSYALAESPNPGTGYSSTGEWSCTGGTLNTAKNAVTLALGDNVTCTLTNTDNPATLKLVKDVTNNDGGDKTAADFKLYATAGTARDFSSQTASPIFHSVFAAQGYVLSEDAVTGYTAGTWSCDKAGALSGSTVTLALGDNVTCTLTNTDNTPHLRLVKDVTNDNGGTAQPHDWTLYADTSVVDFTGRNFSDVGDSVVSHSVYAGKGYALSESSVYGYTAGTWSCDGGSLVGSTVTLALGADVTCTITNDDDPGRIVIIKNATPQSGVFTFATTGTTSGPGTSWPASFTLSGDPTGGANTRSFTLDAGSYTVNESTQLGWILTGIGADPADPDHPYNCTVTGDGGSTGVGDLNTQTATINLENGDTVTCVFENSGRGVTRTQGFWATHTRLADVAWFGGTAFGHTFPGVASVSGIGDTLICGRSIDTIDKLMGGFWSGISKKSTGAKRTSLDQARMQLLQQLLAAELNASAFGAVPSGGSGMFAAWESALCGTNPNAIKIAQQQAASFNTQGDSGLFTPGTSADSKYARSIANYLFWDIIKP